MLTESEGKAKYGELFWWWGTQAAEGDCNRQRRQIGRSRQYGGVWAEYSHPWKPAGSDSTKVEVTVQTSKRVIGKTIILARHFDARPRDTALEVAWAENLITRLAVND